MLNKKDLLEDVEEIYVPMLKEIDIVDFTKCIAQFSGLHLHEVSDEVIKSYLITWAKNKYRFYKMLGNKIKVDKAIKYDSQEIDMEAKINELRKEYPAYALWLEGFRRADKNKVQSRDISYQLENTIKELFATNIEGSTITHFFKKYLQAPDDLVTRIGRIWENQKIEGTYTISIDPVDMMLASENPYNWTSCYRLEVFNDGSHADGCVAAILDASSLITYVWNREGKFSLYDNYDFKNVRYFRMRQWIAISPKETAIHFNKIYPGKGSYSQDFEKQLREIVEDLVNKDAVWTRNEDYKTNCHRTEAYGYGEFSYNYIYKIKDARDEVWFVYDERILCPCGCGDYLPGSDDAEDEDGDIYEYNGEGFITENFNFREPEGEWCDYLDDYCECQDCENCVYWNRCHPVCELDVDHECEYADDAEGDNKFDPYETNVVPCGGHCDGCPFYEEHYRDNEQEPENE